MTPRKINHLPIPAQPAEPLRVVHPDAAAIDRMFAGGDLADGRLQVAHQLDGARAVCDVEGREFIEDVVAVLDARMAKHLPAGHHLEGDANEAQGHLDAFVPRVFPLTGPLGRQHVEVMVANDEVVGDAENGGAKGMIAIAHQWTVGLITRALSGTDAPSAPRT